MFGNGAATGMVLIHRHLRPTRQGPVRAPTACCAAVTGAAMLRTAVSPSVTSIRRRAAAITTASASPSVLRIKTGERRVSRTALNVPRGGQTKKASERDGKGREAREKMSSNPAPAKTKLWQDKYSYIKVRRPRIGTSGFIIRTATEKWTIMTHRHFASFARGGCLFCYVH